MQHHHQQGLFLLVVVPITCIFLYVLISTTGAWYFSSSGAGILQVSENAAVPKMRILLGVLTTAAKLERRSLLRIAYGLQQEPEATEFEVVVKFVIGRPKNAEESILINAEILRYGDIVLSTIASSGEEYSYVMKTDDDSYVRLHNLAASLQNLSRTDLYYGYVLPCENNDPFVEYMAGMGYLLSWDLVKWIQASIVAANNTVGTEDKLVADWLNAGGKAKFRVNKKPMFYDHPAFGGSCAHELTSDTILIHQLKNMARWMDVLSYFEGRRFTAGEYRLAE